MNDLFNVIEQGPMWIVVLRYVFLLAAATALFVLWGVSRD